MLDIKLIYLFLGCFVLAMLYKITHFLEQEESKAISKKELFKLAVIVLIYGIFGAVLGVIVYLSYEYYLQTQLTPHLQLLGYGLAGMIGTIGTTGVSILHRFIDRKVKNV